MTTFPPRLLVAAFKLIVAFKVAVPVALGPETFLSSAHAQDDPAPQPTDIPFAQKPYRVDLSISVTGTGRGRSLEIAGLAADIREAVTRMYGRMWDVSVSGRSWLQPGTGRQLNLLTVDEFVDRTNPEEPAYRFPEQSFDKSMIVCVESTTAGFTVACREYDCRLQELTPVRQAATPDARGIVALAAQLIRDSFRPCLQFVRTYRDDDRQEFVEVQTQAGELPPPDPSARQIQEGDILRLFVRSMEKRDPTTLRAIRPLWMNYIRVLSVDNDVIRGLVTGVLMSHAAVSPFGQRGRHVQHLALRQRPAASSSSIRLVNLGQDNRPLACQRVSMVYKLRVSDGDQAEQVRLLSDRNGMISIPLQDGFPTVWLYVYSGAKLLARVPYAPGLIPEDTIELPDDTIRLSVEGDLQLLQDQLIDVVAMREVHFSLAKKAAAEKRADDLEQHLKDYAASPALSDFSADLAAIRVAAQRQADKVGNRRARQAVEKMCRNIERSLENFFSDGRRQKRADEMEDLREAAKG